MIKLTWTCPKHKRYNPELHGQGGIRGACAFCQRLFDEWLRWHQWIGELRDRH